MNLSPLPVQRFYSNIGLPLVGGKLFTYAAGTTTKIATYQNETGTPNSNPVVMNFRGEANVWLDPTLTYKFVLAGPLDTDPPANPIWTVDNIAGSLTILDFTQQFLGRILYPRTAGEIAAAITPVNYWYPEGWVDRYGTNAIPGTTDMATAANAAYKVASHGRCAVVFGPTAPYRFNSPINCTQMRGIVTNDYSAANLSAGAPSVIIAHDGTTSSHGFDLSASTEMVFNNVVAANLAGKIPNCVFFMARNAAKSGAGMHRFNNCRTDASATFRHIIYNYGSEETNHNDGVYYQNQGGSTICNHNANNPSGYTSSFLTIATPPVSNVTHRYNGCDFFQLGNSGSSNEVVFQIEATGNLSCTDGSFYNPHGLSYVNGVGTSAMFDMDFKNMRGEDDGVNLCLYGYIIQTTTTTGVNAHTNWTFKNCRAVAGEFLRLGDAAEMVGMDITVCSASSGVLVNAYLMSYSRIMHGTSNVNGRVGGTIQSNTFIGNRAQVVLQGTDALNTGFNQTLGRYWESGDSYTAPSTACTGAITTSVVWSLTKYNRTVRVSLPSIAATATAATNFVFGAVLPAAYRPAADLRIPIIVRDNGATPNQQGMVIVTAASGAMTVFKDIAATATFSTTANGEGLPGTTEISWTI